MNARPSPIEQSAPAYPAVRRGGALFPMLRGTGFKSLCLLLFLVFILSCMGCRDFAAPVNDLAAARYAESVSDIAEAEMHYERFLRKNPQSPARWDVWNRLLNIALNIRQEKSAAVIYLEIMLEEFAGNDERRRAVELTLAGISNDLRDYDRAVELWESLVNNENTSAEDKAECLRNLSHVYLLQLQFEAATTALETCLKLDISDTGKGRCLFDLAESQILQGELAQAKASLLRLISMGPEKEEDVLARFILADVLEQEGRMDDALELFKTIRSAYPNNKAVEIRIAALEKRKKKKK